MSLLRNVWNIRLELNVSGRSLIREFKVVFETVVSRFIAFFFSGGYVVLEMT